MQALSNLQNGKNAMKDESDPLLSFDAMPYEASANARPRLPPEST
jgi:hypothetical protein